MGAKEVNGLKHVTIYQGQSQIELRPAQAYSNQVDNWKLSVNGQQVQLRKNEKIPLKSDLSTRARLSLLRSTTPPMDLNVDSVETTTWTSELKKKGVSSLILRRPRSRVSLILNCMTADPSRSTLTSTRMTKSASLRFLLFSAPSTPCQEK